MLLFALIAVIGCLIGLAVFIGQLVVIRRWYWPQFQREWKWFRHGHKRGFFDALGISVDRVWEDRSRDFVRRHR